MEQQHVHEYRERLSALEAKQENLAGLVEEVARSLSSLSDDLRNYTRESEARQVTAQDADRRRIARLEAQSGTNWQTLFGAAAIAVTLGGVIAHPHLLDVKQNEQIATETADALDAVESRVLVLETERRIERGERGVTSAELAAALQKITESD